MKPSRFVLIIFVTMLTFGTASAAEILNASYDVARELFAAVNPAFASEWKAKTGEELIIRQSHGGSSKQARFVGDGLPADVVTLNQVTDIDLLQRAGLIGADWRQRLPNNSSPYYSLPVFLVRAGNPKKIADWNDLVKPGIHAVFPNPKTSGNGRYTYLAAYGVCARREQRRSRQGCRVRQQAACRCTGLRHGWPRRDHDVHRTGDRRRAGDVRVRSHFHPQRIRQEPARGRDAVRQLAR